MTKFGVLRIFSGILCILTEARSGLIPPSYDQCILANTGALAPP